MDDVTVIKTVSERLGFKQELKDAQIECLCNVLNKQDCIAILSTGYGKSLIYQLSPHILKEKYGLDKSSCLILTPLALNSYNARLSFIPTKHGYQSMCIEL